jgi:prevent-host-death family protein
MQQVDLNEAKTRLTDLIEEAIKGEEVVITKNDQPMVKLVPISQVSPRPQFGGAKVLITMSEDFDEPIEHFKDYVMRLLLDSHTFLC